ncbi:MAG: preprotein translocase subunit SecG [Paracoccaceae bacterium]
MENIVLSIHLILALCLIATVLLQRSEGGGLGMGGGGGGAVSGRSAANALTKLTWILAIGFLITSLSLTVIAANKAGQNSVLDRLGVESIDGELLIPDLGDAPLTPPADSDAPTAPPASE